MNLAKRVLIDTGFLPRHGRFMKDKSNKPAQRRPIRRVLFGAFAGFFLVNLLRAGPYALLGFAEILQRFCSWVTGAGGESAQWGEPLFWLIMIGAPGMVAGAVLAMTLELTIYARQRQTQTDL